MFLFVCISFLCLSALAKISGTLLDRIGGNGYLSLTFDLRSKVFGFFTIEYKCYLWALHTWSIITLR